MSDSADQNLSGLWHGQYSYPAGPPPVAFVAELLDVAGALSGSITEKSILPPRIGETLYATVRGQHGDNAVLFSKLYQTDDERYQVVAYDGQLSADRSEIEGTWRTGGWHGRFLMIRGTRPQAEIETEILENVT